MIVQDHKFDGRPQVDLLRETITDDLRTVLFALRDDLEMIDGSGEIHTYYPGILILVVDPGSVDRPLSERILDISELALHHAYGLRPHRSPTRTPFDIRTKEHGGRQDDEDLPW